MRTSSGKRIYRITGFNRQTGEIESANVLGWSHKEAMALMGMSHRRLTCLDKTGVEPCRLK